MIIQQRFNERLVRTYSDKGNKIEQQETRVVYDEAIDLSPCRFTYKETDIHLETEEAENDGT